MKLFNEDCRDVMQSEEYLQYIDNKNVIVVTDPPFNIGFRYDEYKDNMPESDYMDMLTNICKGAAVVIHYPEGLLYKYRCWFR